MLENTGDYQSRGLSIEQYRQFADVKMIKENAGGLRDVKILHINSVGRGGGVAAILSRIIPVFKSLGLKVEWYIPDVEDMRFFKITKKQHNMLQGIGRNSLTREEEQIYWNIQRNVAEKIRKKIRNYDLVIIHDTQYAGIINFFRNNDVKWIYRCHIDTSNPNPEIYEFFIDTVKKFDAAIYHLEKFVLKDSPHPYILLPSIDPLESKNDPSAVSQEFIYSTVRDLGLDPERPILLQVGRFDPAKGFEDVSEVYKRLKRKYPEIQLLLTGAGAKDDPEFYEYIKRIKDNVRGIEGVVVKELPFDVLKLNAVQQAGTVVYALSRREGFGLVVSEASIKKKPVIVTNVGGLVVQVVDGKTGFVINSIDEAVEKTEILLKNPEVRLKMGEEGRKYILSNFITPIHVNNYIKIFKSVLCL